MSRQAVKNLLAVLVGRERVEECPTKWADEEFSGTTKYPRA